MIKLDDCVEIGTIKKTHGVQGQLVVKLTNLSFDDIFEMELVFIQIDGLPVPFFIEEFSERLPDSLILKLEGIDTDVEAKKFTSLPIFTDKKYLSDKNISSIQQFDPLIGYTVVDMKLGKLGTLGAIISNPENPLLLITKGIKEILLPLQEEFIQSIDDYNKEILVNSPEGLLGLYE